MSNLPGLLLLGLACVPALHAAIVGGLRVNFDTSNTNTTSVRVTVSGQTNLNSGTVNATNRVTVGRTGEAGVVTLSSTNSTYAVTQSLASDGTYTLAYGTTNMLTVLVGDDSGWTGAGTNFLADDGTFKFVAGGGDSIWTNVSGTITAISDGADGTTAFAMGTDASRTSGSLLNITNAAYHALEVNYQGNIAVGPNAVALYGPLDQEALVSVRLEDTGEVPNTGIFLESADSAAFLADAYTDYYVSTSGTNTAEAGFNLNAITGGGTLAYELVVISNSATNQLQQRAYLGNSADRRGWWFEPTVPDGSTPFTMGSTITHTTGDMLGILNNGTNIFTVAAVSGYAGGGTKFLSDNGTYIANPFFFNSGLGYIENLDHTQEQFRIVNTANSGLSVFATAGSQAVTLGTNVTIAPYNPDSTANPAFLFDATANWTTTNLVFRVRDNGGTPLFGVAGESGWTGAGTLVLTDDGTYKSVAGASGVTASSTNTFTNKTFDAAATGNVLTQTKQLPLFRFPDSVDGAGCTYINTNDFTARTFMRPRFSAAGATNANFATFSCLVPSDFSTAVDPTATIKVALVAGDTDVSTYTLGMASVANSASSSPTAANYITLTVPADGSGAAGDVEGVNGVTLTGWGAAMTAGQWLYIQLQRDGADASATAEDLLALEITYTSTQ